MISKKEFTEQVEQILMRTRTDVMDAIITVCERNNLEPESAKRLSQYHLKKN